MLLSVDSSTQLLAQDLERQLASEPAATLARAAREEGDARRGAILFHQPHLACAKCHVEAEPAQRLGPDLAGPADEARRISDELLVEAILSPSKVIRPGFETIVVSTTDGESIQGLLVEDRADSLVLRDVGQAGKLITLSKKQIDRRQISAVSLMPAGQANQLTSRQQFLDLVKYLIEIRDGGPPRALALQPDPSLVAALELPEYETQLDHAGLIGGWNAGSL
ncbi:MAG: heme-binding protein, partial [Pirellulaceae bacterium]|nr:heme-binding protein [Pirellulaceae bacterium]